LTRRVRCVLDTRRTWWTGEGARPVDTNRREPMRFHRSLAGAALAALIIVVAAAVALAASPKKGAKFKGTLSTSAGPVKYGKYSDPVTFKVSSSGTKLLSFRWGTLGCFGSGGPVTSNPYLGKYGLHHFGAVSVSAGGSFSVPASKSTYKVSGGSGKSKYTVITTTTSSLTGQFASPKRATGTITFSQKEVDNGKSSNCGPAILTFTAKG
jgi:hypothetical protein